MFIHGKYGSTYCMLLCGFTLIVAEDEGDLHVFYV